MFLGLDTFEWIAIIAVILVLVTAWVLIIAVIKHEDPVVRLESFITTRADRLFDDLREIVRSAENDLGKDLKHLQTTQDDNFAAIATCFGLGLPSDKIYILELDDEIKKKLINFGPIGEMICSLEWWLDARKDKRNKIEEIPSIGDKEIKKIEKALADYKENHFFATA